MNQFDEKIFLYAMTTRPEDARRYYNVFNPEWLYTVEYRPVLFEIFKFLKKHGTPPTIKLLHQIFEDQDKELYALRMKVILDMLASNPPETPDILYTLDQVRDVCIIRSFQTLCADQEFLQKQGDFEGNTILNAVYRWVHQFIGTQDEETANIKEAITKLIEEQGVNELAREKIASGIVPLDEWTNGGGRGGELHILMAPTGQGKSAVLLNMAFKMALQHDVWFVTNELTMEEQTERFLARITGESLILIQNDPYIAYHGLGRHWATGLHDRLRLTSVNREVSTSDLESTMSRWINITGWSPRVIILDFMERMKPNESGYFRGKEWIWMQAIARDLTRLAKRHKILIWTAAQTNRSGLSSRASLMEQVQGSIRHFQEASMVVGLVQKTVPDIDGSKISVIDFYQHKIRHGKKASYPVRLKVDLDKMLITDKVVNVTVDVWDSELEKERNRGNDKNTIPANKPQSSKGNSKRRDKPQ